MTKQAKLGALGERLVAELLGLTLSENTYDSEKDAMDAFSKTYEIKTQCRHPTKSLLTISAPDGDGRNLTNLIKCLTVDFLIFVEYNSSDYIKVFHCVDRSTYEIYVTAKGKRMIGFPIDKMKLLHSVYDPDLARAMRENSSAYNFIKG